MATDHIIIENKIIKINETQQVVRGELNRNPTKFKSLYKSSVFYLQSLDLSQTFRALQKQIKNVMSFESLYIKVSLND